MGRAAGVPSAGSCASNFVEAFCACEHSSHPFSLGPKEDVIKGKFARAFKVCLPTIQQRKEKFWWVVEAQVNVVEQRRQ